MRSGDQSHSDGPSTYIHYHYQTPNKINPKQLPISKGAVQILRQYFDHNELHYPSAVVKQALAIETVRHFACLVSVIPQVAPL